MVKNQSGMSLIVAIIIVALAVSVGIFGWLKMEKHGAVISGTGTVRFIDLEGGFYGIEADDGQKYDAINLNAQNPQFREFLIDGLRVKFVAREKPDYVSVHMWGRIILIDRIEKLIDETANWQTYKNEQYGFEIKYPLENTFREVSQSLMTRASLFAASIDPNFLTITIERKPQNFYSLSEYVGRTAQQEKEFGKNAAAPFNNQIRGIDIGKEKATLLRDWSSDVALNTDDKIYIERNDQIFMIRYSFPRAFIERPSEFPEAISEIERANSRFDKINTSLSTFRFTK